MTNHAIDRRVKRAPCARFAHAIEVPPRVIRRMLGHADEARVKAAGRRARRHYGGGKKRHAGSVKHRPRQQHGRHFVTPTGIFVVVGDVVVTVLEVDADSLGTLLLWAMTGYVVGR